METLYFILGMLSIIATISIGVIVWGVVKTTKLLKQVKLQEEYIADVNKDLWGGIEHRYEDLQRRLDGMNRNAHDRVTDLQREIEKRIDDSNAASFSYTDRRIDKLVDTYFEMKDLNKCKQILKG